MTISSQISARYAKLKPLLNEKQRRCFLACEAEVIGKGGASLVCASTNSSYSLIRRGKKELSSMNSFTSPKDVSRIRNPGGGRKREVDKNPKLREDLNSMISPVTRGDPESPLLWICKSLRNLTSELKKLGHKTNRTTIGELLHEMGFSLQSNRKRFEGKDHPDRNDQFENISKHTLKYQSLNFPVISVDSKKKELIGNFKNNGAEWQKKGFPTEVEAYDFPSIAEGKATPYGIYDIRDNTGWVNVGISNDTAEFAVSSIRSWWNSMGRDKYPNANHLLITADCGGSNGYRVKLWKRELQKLADDTCLQIRVMHFPPGTSKWNKIEHRLFSYISKNWRGKPLVSYQTIVNLIESTKTEKGLKVAAQLDKTTYEKGIKVSKNEMKNINISNDQFHGEWNYTILPKNETITT